MAEQTKGSVQEKEKNDYKFKKILDVFIPDPVDRLYSIYGSVR